MKNLIAALEVQHKDSKVVEIRFTSINEPISHEDILRIEDNLVEMVKEDVPISLEELIN